MPTEHIVPFRDFQSSLRGFSKLSANPVCIFVKVLHVKWLKWNEQLSRTHTFLLFHLDLLNLEVCNAAANTLSYLHALINRDSKYCINPGGGGVAGKKIYSIIRDFKEIAKMQKIDYRENYRIYSMLNIFIVHTC